MLFWRAVLSGFDNCLGQRLPNWFLRAVATQPGPLFQVLLKETFHIMSERAESETRERERDEKAKVKRVTLLAHLHAWRPLFRCVNNSRSLEQAEKTHSTVCETKKKDFEKNLVEIDYQLPVRRPTPFPSPDPDPTVKIEEKRKLSKYKNETSERINKNGADSLRWAKHTLFTTGSTRFSFAVNSRTHPAFLVCPCRLPNPIRTASHSKIKRSKRFLLPFNCPLRLPFFLTIVKSFFF